MLARVAESIYWMARQVERAENLARFLEITHTFQLDQPETTQNPWEALVQVTGDTAWFKEHYPTADEDNVTAFIAFDRDYGSSMISSLAWARQNARSVREVLSSEIYESINDLYQFVHQAEHKPHDVDDDFLVEVRRLAIQFSGVLDHTMPRDLAWHFANVGRLIERADKTSRILDVKYFQLLPSEHGPGTAVDDLQWAALLQACSGIEAYRREHQYVDITKVVEFFLFSQAFPRSVVFCVSGVKRSLHRIIELANRSSQSKASQAACELMKRLDSMDAGSVVAGGMHQFIDRLQLDLNDVSDALGRDYMYLEEAKEEATA
ncbi:MAG: alpha-E domain-containing protein [Planctomycetota bacterium]